ncbi:MAG: Gfo/Idh/MocA family oxidoreductase [Pirellulaceae bacterium]|nr:Gfo/Idh/MocA family oxidoreductase [Pirellulaceae bacterium]
MRSASRRRFLGWTLGTGGALAFSAAGYRRIQGANERVGLGFIGYGLIGKRHVADCRREPGFDLVALSDVHRGRQEEGLAAIGGGAKGHSDFRRLLDDPRVQAVIVSTPDHWHALQTILACDAGKDVYVEKPLTLFQREGQWMQQVARRTSRVVQVGTQQRSGKHYQRARELLQKGSLGKVHSVRAAATRNIGFGFGRPADIDPPPELDWNLWLGPAPARTYNPLRAMYHFRWFWDYSGGQMTNLGAHHFDIVDWILGLARLRSVTSIGGRFILQDGGETPDTQDALFDCGEFSLAWTLREASRGQPDPFGLDFFGANGQLSLSRAGFQLTADPDLPAASSIPGIGEHPVGGPIKPAPTTGGKRWRAEPIDDQSGSSDEQFQSHLGNFLACIRSRETPLSDLASAHRTATACHLANLSLRLGRQLRWDAASELIVGDAEAQALLERPYRAPWDKELAACLR